MSTKPTLYFVYSSGPARSIILLLNKFNVLDKVELKEIDIMKGENRTPEFLDMNPFHTVPTLKHGDLSLYESTAIIEYLCEIFELNGEYGIPKDIVAKYKTINMLHKYHNLIAPGQRNIVMPYYSAFFSGQPLNVDDIKNGLAKTKAEQYAQLDAILAKNGGFVTGATPTAADIHYWIDLYQMVKFDYPADNYVTMHIYDFEEHPNIQKWLKAVKEAVYVPEISEKPQEFIGMVAQKIGNGFRLLDNQ